MISLVLYEKMRTIHQRVSVVLASYTFFMLFLIFSSPSQNLFIFLVSCHFSPISAKEVFLFFLKAGILCELLIFLFLPELGLHTPSISAHLLIPSVSFSSLLSIHEFSKTK